MFVDVEISDRTLVAIKGYYILCVARKRVYTRLVPGVFQNNQKAQVGFMSGL